MVKVIVPATSANLGPGFDTLGVALDMHNVIEMAETGIFDVVIEVEGNPELERPEQNLVYRAARQVFERLRYEPYGLQIRQEVGIPIARGLGSSASAIVGGLVAANALAEEMTGRTGLTTDQLLEMAIAIEGHPDNVTPALLGGFTITCMDNGRPLYLRFDPPPTLQAVVAIPEVPLATKKARGVLPEAVTLADAVFNVSRATLLVASLMMGRLDLLAAAQQDRLHQPYRVTLVPGLQEVFRAAMAAGAKGVALSGSGPTVIALVDRGAEQVGTAMEAAFQWHGSDCRTATVNLAHVGARVLAR